MFLDANSSDYLMFDIRHIGDYFPEGIIIFDVDGKILYLNSANAEMIGISKDMAIGNNVSDFVGGIVINTYLENATTFPVLIGGEKYVSISTAALTGKQLMETGVPIQDSDGKVLGAILIDTDIAEFDKKKEKLDSTEARFQSYDSMQAQMVKALAEYYRGDRQVIYKSSKTDAVYERAIKVAPSDAVVLITGETGSGKEVFADLIQAKSTRNDKPYVKINCAAIPESLFESELFGYERGAFTGAAPKGKAGIFELAYGGTLLLDEIGEIPLPVQAKLLRVLQSNKVIRVGGTNSIDLDVRIIASTNRDLKKLVDEGKFRQDLFYRLNILNLYVPPLRERIEDIEPLTQMFLKKFNQKYKKKVVFSPSVYFNLKNYSWPGNIRELENLVERWVVIFDDNSFVRWEQLGYSNLGSPHDEQSVDSVHDDSSNISMKGLVDDYRREILIWAKNEFKTARGMADNLKTDHSTIVKMAKRLGVSLLDDG